MREQTVTCRLVPESQRLAITAEFFGTYFPLRIEPTIFNVAGQLAASYSGGYWNLLIVSTRDGDAFCMWPSGGGTYAVESPNGWSGTLTADALGICACLFAYSGLSFTAPDAMASILADNFHRLREFAMDYSVEASQIAAVCD